MLKLNARPTRKSTIMDILIKVPATDTATSACSTGAPRGRYPRMAGGGRTGG